MKINIHEFANKDIICKRKTGYSLKQIHKSFMGFEPLIDNLLALNHVVRICHEQGLPFTATQVKRVFNKTYIKYSIHGSRNEALKFLKKWFGKKIIQFKTEKTHPYQKVTSSPRKNIVGSVLRADFNNYGQIPLKTTLYRENTLKQGVLI